MIQDPKLQSTQSILALIEKTVECISRKDQTVRETKKDFDTMKSNHDRTISDSQSLIYFGENLVSQLSNTEMFEIDERRLETVKKSVSSAMESMSSSIFFNVREIDECIVKSLKYLRFEKSQPINDQAKKYMVTVKDLDSKNPLNKRDNILQTMYEFFRTQLENNSTGRMETMRRVVDTEIDILNVAVLLNVESNLSENPNQYIPKINVTQEKISKLFEDLLERIILIRTQLNELIVKFKHIVEDSHISVQEAMTNYDSIHHQLFDVDELFYNVVLMDIGLLYSLISKSYQLTNRRLYESIRLTANTYIAAQNSHLYLNLIESGIQRLPSYIELFLSHFTKQLTQRHAANVGKYLVPDFDAEDSPITEEEAFRDSIIYNYKYVCKAIDLAINTLNEYLDEASNGRNKDGINYSICHRNYPVLMLKLDPKLALLEGFK